MFLIALVAVPAIEMFVHDSAYGEVFDQLYSLGEGSIGGHGTGVHGGYGGRGGGGLSGGSYGPV